MAIIDKQKVNKKQISVTVNLTTSEINTIKRLLSLANSTSNVGTIKALISNAKNKKLKLLWN